MDGCAFKLLRAVVFLIFFLALIGGVNCLMDSSRASEHHAAAIGLAICVVGCVISAVNPAND